MNLQNHHSHRASLEDMMGDEISSRKDDNTQDSLRIVAGFGPYCNSLAWMTGDCTFWKHMMWIRFPMMFQSICVALIWKILSLFITECKKS